MSGWMDWAPGVDLTGCAARVLGPDGAQQAAGVATTPGTIAHPMQADLLGVPLGVDPDGPDLDEGVREIAHMAREALLGPDPRAYVAPDGQPVLVEIMVGLAAGSRVQYRDDAKSVPA